MRRLLVAVAAGAALAFAPAAVAHVTAQPLEQTAGGFTKIVFRMPNERPVPTVKLEVQLPPELDAVRVAAVPGWTYKLTRRKLPQPREVFGQQVTDYVATIEWTGRLGVDEFQEFPVSMRLPDKGTFGSYVVFPALQSYQGGEVVRWIQRPDTPEGNFDELEEPAPRVLLAAAEEEVEQEEPEQPAFATEEKLDDEVGDARTLGIAGLIVGAIALVLALLAVWRPFRRA